MVMPPNEWKILECDEKHQTNKQKKRDIFCYMLDPSISDQDLCPYLEDVESVRPFENPYGFRA